ncbi:MAG TPA: hydrogenase maturation nickel metallochaperone HypA [Candidatus Solibacter sp.]|nr:hydrogenase maturation nickel metallochaperone HypA [Candidatus Solibacter sp.]
MHELSIAMGIVDAALEEARRREVQVSAVHLRLGVFSGVVKDALLFSYEAACQDTALQGSRLIVEDLPVVVFCAECQAQRALDSIQQFACPVCGTPTMDIRQGREIEVFALEVVDQQESSSPSDQTGSRQQSTQSLDASNPSKQEVEL